MRVLALDLGSRRIGVAVSDAGRVLATPAGVVERHRSGRAADHRRIADLVAEYEAGLVVVGLPLSLDGSHGPAAAAVVDEVEELRRVVGVPVDTYDERLTTVTATRQLRERGVTGRRARAAVDETAATVLLQGWLDRNRNAPGAHG